MKSDGNLHGSVARQGGSQTNKSKDLDSGVQPFSIESRIIREFGERLVKKPEVALLELIKNAHDADADFCRIEYAYPQRIVVLDNGHGMTRDEFLNGWMRIGTSAKEATPESRLYQRPVSGEKGIGRFAVRYLGRKLYLSSTAFDPQRGFLTTVTASFDWQQFDQNEDLGTVLVPYRVSRAEAEATIGTRLEITDLRLPTAELDFRQIESSSLGLVSPYRHLLRPVTERDDPDALKPSTSKAASDPGFTLQVVGDNDAEIEDVSAKVLSNFVLRCVVTVEKGRLKLRLYRRGDKQAWLKIDDRFQNTVSRVYADLRFFPARKGTFTDLGVDGQKARSWARKNSGVAVFDRNFRVLPYGLEGDDWLKLADDAARNQRHPRSWIAKRHFPMDSDTQKSTSLNYMLRLPASSQLIGAVQVFGVRTTETDADTGLLATADRQGFVDNAAYRQLFEVVRGAAEAIAFADRELQFEEDRAESERAAQAARQQLKSAVDQINENPDLAPSDKRKIVAQISQAQAATDRQENLAKGRESALEVMSLLGIVAGFMTHEFGTALVTLERSHAVLHKLAASHSGLRSDTTAIAANIAQLRDFISYSQAYVRGTTDLSNTQEVPAKPRIRQVTKIFGKYASERRIKLSIDVDTEVLMPKVPLSLYSGIVLNLYTNALKAITSKNDDDGRREIAFRAWKGPKGHLLQVSDTGVGIPNALQDRIFDPLFTTTAANRDPLGSGLGLGLSLVRRGARAFGGSVNVVKPPPGFATCFEVQFPDKDTL